MNSLAIKLPTFLSWVCLSWWLFPFLATLILLSPISLLYIVHAHCLQRGTGRMEYMRHCQVSPSSFTLQSALWNVLSILRLINHPSILEKPGKQERDAYVKAFLWQKGIGKGYRAMPLWHLSCELFNITLLSTFWSSHFSSPLPSITGQSCTPPHIHWS